MEHLLLAVIGAGGKTTALSILAAAASPRRVLLTTTTHILPVAPPRSRILLRSPTPADLLAQLEQPGVVCAGSWGPEGKLGPLSADLLAQAVAAADLTLCEADGARRLPLKLHRPGEPAIPAGTGRCLIVAGLSALGRPVGQAVHRYERNPRWLQNPNLPVGPEELLYCVTEAIQACGLPGDRLRVLLNQADAPGREAQALPVAEALKKQGLDCRVGSLAQDGAFLGSWLLAE